MRNCLKDSDQTLGMRYKTALNKARLILYKLTRKIFFPLLNYSWFSIKIKWLIGLHLVEPHFFENYLTTKNDKYLYRLNPEMLVLEYLSELLTENSQEHVKILDVGAGPITKVGYKLANKTVELYPIDPLANIYAGILRRYNIQPPVKTILGKAEELSKQFGRNEFDLVYANNSIDHTANPVRAINEIYHVLKPNQYFYFSHFINEGEIHNYYGLHQWNFYSINDFLYLSNKTKNIEINISEEFDQRFSIEISVIKRRLTAKFKKLY